jgi:hypothetical protein
MSLFAASCLSFSNRSMDLLALLSMLEMYDVFPLLWQQVQRFAPSYMACLCCVLTFICISLIVLLLCILNSRCRIIGGLQKQLTEKQSELYNLTWAVHNLPQPYRSRCMLYEHDHEAHIDRIAQGARALPVRHDAATPTLREWTVF